MRSARAILAVVLCATAMLFVAGSEARSQTFDYVFCNKTTIKVFVAVATLVSAGDKRFKVAGWWTIPAEQCADIGAFPKGWAYYYAEQDEPGTARWEADDVGICVEYPGPFERILMPNYSCGSNQKIQGFKSIFVDAGAASVTITLNPLG